MKVRKTFAFLFIPLPLIIIVCAGNNRRDDTSPVDGILSSLTLEQKIGQMIMPAVPGKKMTPQLETILKKYSPGGVIFFGYNLGSPDEVKKFTASIQKYSIECSGIPVLISVDQEGGRVKRLTEGVTQFPGNMAAGAAFDKKLTYLWGRVLGLELRLLGINMNLTPVLDINDNPDNPVINTRSFGADIDTVSVMGRAYIKGQQESRCVSVGKHFPGLGNSGVDTHLKLTVIDFDMKRLEDVELKPFGDAIKDGLECIMTTHSAFPKILMNRDSATVSPFFLTDVLRDKMKFKGLILTDDMEMGAITKEFMIGDAAVKSVAAGTDIILLSTYGASIEKIYTSLISAAKDGRISPERINDSARRVLETKLKYGILSCDENRKVVPPGFSLTDAEKDILEKGKETNRELSKKSISYRGDAALLESNEETVRIFVSNTPVFTNSLSLNKNDVKAADFGSAVAIIDRLPKNVKRVLYVYSYSSQPAYFGSIRSACQKRGIPLVAAVSGDPFPLLRSGAYDTLVMSFSNTSASLEFLAKACSGVFAPRPDTKLLPEKR